MKFRSLLAGALVLSLGTVLFYRAAGFPPQNGSEKGVFMPTSGSDQETPKPHRTPVKDHAADQIAQVTVGGTKYFVSGGIRNIQGSHCAGGVFISARDWR